ncbi:uncharacterized protein LOC116977954 [Amblyraja radiata]|uniref:uncharacterized protein LOC116977954 n=1 Tax=Amblyraja radiata TaxID=386614 RepID=UPI001403C70E|nr:uncharacterized protein LOC116977954 [Amblyraja radiata]
MDPTEDISDSVRAYVSKAITMETEVTENTIDHQERINVNAAHECTGLKDVNKMTNTSKFITTSTLTTHDENYNNNSDNTKQELQEVLTIEKVLDQTTQIETISSSYETSKVIYASIHKEHFKDYSAVVVADTMTQKDLEVTGRGTGKKPFPAEVYLEELVENLQSRKEMGKIMTVAARTRSRKESRSNQSVFTSNGIMFENSKISQIEENGNRISTIDLSTLIMKSPNVLVAPQDNKDSIGLSAVDLNGKTISSSGSNSNQTSSSVSICEQDLENLTTDSQNGTLPIATPPLQYKYEFGSDHVNKAKPFQKHSYISQRDRGFFQKNESAESLTSLSRKLVLEIMELQHRTLKNNPSQNGEARIRPRSIKAQTTKPFQREKQINEVLEVRKMEKGHVDFATARKQWLKLEAISKTHSYRSVVKEQNKTVTKYVTKEKIVDHSINKSKNNEAAHPNPGSMFSEDNMQSKESKGMKTDEVECLRKSTNPNQEQVMEALQENDETVGNLDKKLLSDSTYCSPCPEGSDSSLDDWTYGYECNSLSDPGFQDEFSCSPPMAREKPETPIEREIRHSLKREESLRKARGLAKHPYSEKFVEIKTRPLNLQSFPSTSSSKVKNNQFAEMQMQREILLERKREEDLVQEGKIMGKHEENTIPEIETRRKFFEQKNPFQFPFPNKMLASPIATPATLLVVPPMKRGPSSNETNFSNVVILPNDPLTSDNDKSEVNDAVLKLEYPKAEIVNIVILETPNSIIERSSYCPPSSLSLNQREGTLQNNPFFKLRSHGAQSIISQEIREVLQREEELYKQRCSLHGLRRASEESLPSSSAVNNLPSGQESSKNTSQECPGTTVGDC